MSQQFKKKPDIVCLCNHITRTTIEGAIREGADTLNKIYDCTQAGVGPCGGSCRRKIAPMLDTYLETGIFPEPPASNRKKITG